MNRRAGGEEGERGACMVTGRRRRDVAPISGVLEAGVEPADAGRQLFAVLSGATERHSTSCSTQQNVTGWKPEECGRDDSTPREQA